MISSALRNGSLLADDAKAGNQVVQGALDHVTGSVPQAIAGLQVIPQTLGAMVLAKVTP